MINQHYRGVLRAFAIAGIVVCITMIFFVPANSEATTPIIIDHASVNLYSQIPDEYITAIKKMWFNLPGESHSSGYRKGLNLLAGLEPTYAVVTVENGTPTAYREDALRASGVVRNPGGWWNDGAGEDDWYTNAAGIAYIKNHLAYCNTNNLVITAIGFGWCWDMTWHNSPGGTVDPVYGVRWAGSSVGGPEGDLRWGLDSEDTALTGNSVNMDTYLAATQEYQDYCTTNGYPTKVMFTTGPVDGYSGESGYQRHLKHEHIRNHVNAGAGRILFDYADILAWSDAGEQNLEIWNGHTYQKIHPDNMVDLNGSYVEDGDHIGQVGAIRLGKAVWVLMARIAGWDPDNPQVTVHRVDIDLKTKAFKEGAATEQEVKQLISSYMEIP